MKEPEEIEKLRKILKGRDLYTPVELVRLGIYGSKSGVHRAIRNHELEATFISDRRLVIFKESIIKHVEARLKKRKEKEE